MLESKIQGKIIKALESRGCYIVRVIKASKSGKADLVLCYRGRFVTMECKRQGEKARELQAYNARKVDEAEGFAFVVQSVDEALAALQQVDFRIWGEGIIDA